MMNSAEFEARQAFSNPRIPPILVYQMGKVGSQTVYHSLQNARIANPVLHLHFLSEDLPCHIGAHQNSGVQIPHHLYLGEAVRNILLNNANLRCKVISLVRDPIAFTLSDLFQNPYFASGDVMLENGSIDAEKARRYFEQELKKPETFEYVDDWFDRELKRVFDIDVYASPFPVNHGYATYKKQNVEVLVIRLEDLSTKGPYVIARFLGMGRPLQLVNTNVRERMGGSSEYLRVLQNVRIDASLCRDIYARRFVQHFYNGSMIEKFMDRWAGNNN
jgi:hypothetical protein